MGRAMRMAQFAAAMAAMMWAQSAMAGGWGQNHRAAMAEAKRSGKPVLANFTGSDWCPYCIKLEKEVFDTDEFKKWAAENVVLLMLDFPQRTRQPAAIAKQNQALQEKYGVGGFPTVLLLDADGEVLAKTGYFEGGAQHWIENIDATVQAAKPVPVAIETDVAAAIESAKKSGRCLMLIVDAGESEALDNRAELTLNDSAMHALASSRLKVVRVRRSGDKATPAEALATVGAMFKTMAIDDTPARVVVVDVSGEQPKALVDVPMMPAPRLLAARLEQVLPKRTYTGGWIEQYDDALAFAKENDRMVLLNFTGSDWCGWCMKLDKEVFSTEAFKAYADENLVLVKLDFPQRTEQDPAIKAQNTKLAAKYSIQGYPTIIVLSAKGEPAAQLGYMPGGPDAFIGELKKLK